MAKRVRGPPVSASPPLAVDTGKKETNQQKEESLHCHFHLFGRDGWEGRGNEIISQKSPRRFSEYMSVSCRVD